MLLNRGLLLHLAWKFCVISLNEFGCKAVPRWG
jgi:hypothetical protein